MNAYIIQALLPRQEEVAVKVRVDLEMCQSNGECVVVAPEVFELGDDDLLRYDSEPDEALRERVERAARNCPVQAITVEG
jgi:ferredoxin